MEIAGKICVLALLGSMLALLIKKENPSIAAVTTVVACGAILLVVLNVVEDVNLFLQEITDICGISPEAISTVGKTVGIAILTQLAAGLCKDFGQQSTAGAVELGGTAAILFAAMPLMKTVLKMVEQWL